LDAVQGVLAGMTHGDALAFVIRIDDPGNLAAQGFDVCCALLRAVTERQGSMSSLWWDRTLDSFGHNSYVARELLFEAASCAGGVRQSIAPPDASRLEHMLPLAVTLARIAFGGSAGFQSFRSAGSHRPSLASTEEDER